MMPVRTRMVRADYGRPPAGYARLEGDCAEDRPALEEVDSVLLARVVAQLAGVHERGRAAAVEVDRRLGAELDHRSGQLPERQPGVALGAPVAGHGERAMAADPQGGARVAAGRDVGVELVSSGGEALRGPRHRGPGSDPRRPAAARPGADRRPDRRAACRAGRAAARRRRGARSRAPGATGTRRARWRRAVRRPAARRAAFRGRAGRIRRRWRRACRSGGTTARAAAATRAPRPGAGRPAGRTRRRAGWWRPRRSGASAVDPGGRDASGGGPARGGGGWG